jgi:predicted ATPase
MLPILAEHAIDASKRTQIILTTHSPQLLDAFTDAQPNTTVVRWKNGQTQLINLEPDRLAKWLKEYSLGSLFKSGELEDLQ